MGKSGQRSGREVAAERRVAGFTLIEVVVASLLLMVGLVALLESMSYARRSAELSGNRIEHLHLARKALEVLRKESYSSPLLAIRQGVRPVPGLPSAAGYYNVVENSSARVKDITVVIEWTETTGQEQAVSLTTSMSESLHR
jgi:Tfp pilus assembly protein PilV